MLAVKKSGMTLRIPEATPTGSMTSCSDSKHFVPFQNRHQGAGVEQCIVRYLADDVGEVSEEISLIFICEDCRDTCRVKFNIFIRDPNEVDGGICRNKRFQSVRNGLGHNRLDLFLESHTNLWI